MLIKKKLKLAYSFMKTSPKQIGKQKYRRPFMNSKKLDNSVFGAFVSIKWGDLF
jgi:hypothetical protein